MSLLVGFDSHFYFIRSLLICLFRNGLFLETKMKLFKRANEPLKYCYFYVSYFNSNSKHIYHIYHYAKWLTTFF